MRVVYSEIELAHRLYGRWSRELVEHHAYWNRDRLRFRQIEAGLRVSMKREIRRLCPDVAPFISTLDTNALRLVLVHLRTA